MNTLSDEKIADCLERVADEHSGCFTEEDAEVVEYAINRLRDNRPTLSNKVVDTQDERAQLLQDFMEQHYARCLRASEWDAIVAFLDKHPRTTQCSGDELADRIVDCLCASLRGTDEAADQWTFAGMQDAFFRWPVVERELRRVLSALRTTHSPSEAEAHPKTRWHKDMTEREIRALACDMCAYPEITAPVQGFARGIPWEMHMRAYDAYVAKYREQTALINLYGRGCRGGFSTGELDMFIPGWRDELSERTALLERIAELEGALSRPSDKTVELLREARGLLGDAGASSVRLEYSSIWHERRRAVLAKLDSHLGETK